MAWVLKNRVANKMFCIYDLAIYVCSDEEILQQKSFLIVVTHKNCFVSVEMWGSYPSYQKETAA